MALVDSCVMLHCHEGLADLLQRLTDDRRAVLLEGLHRELDFAGDQVGTAPADILVPVACQVGRAGGRTWAWVGRRGSEEIVFQHVSGVVALAALQLHVGQLRRADRVGYGAGCRLVLRSVIRVHLVRRGNRLVIVATLGPVCNCVRMSLSDLGLTVNQVFWLVISMCVSNIEIPQRLTLAVHLDHPSLHLPHDSFIIWSRPVGRHYDCTMSVAGDVVCSHDVASRDAQI